MVAVAPPFLRGKRVLKPFLGNQLVETKIPLVEQVERGGLEPKSIVRFADQF